MFGRYELVVSNNDGHIIFEGHFGSLNGLSKTLSCFNALDLKFSVIDIVTDHRISAYELMNVFKGENNIL